MSRTPTSVCLFREASDAYVAEIGERRLTGDDFAKVVTRAIQTIPETGGELFLCPGEYPVQSPITVDRPVHFRGPGSGNTTAVENMALLVASDGLSGPLIRITGENSYKGMHGTRLSDFGLVGNGEDGAGTDCLRIEERESGVLAKMFFERLFLDNATRHGLYVSEAGNHLHFRELWSGHHGGHAMSIQDGDRIWMTHCYGYDSQYGIATASSVRDLTVVAPHCRDNSVAGLALNASPVQVLGGRCIRNGKTGVSVNGSAGAFLSGIEAFNNGQTGISITDPAGDGPGGARLAGCVAGNLSELNENPLVPDRGRTIRTARTEGISKVLKNVSARFLYSDEELNQDHGIAIDDGVVDTILTGNRLFGHTSLAVSDSGRRTLTDGTGTNGGDPRSQGEWHEQGREGVEVWDTVNDRLYQYVGGTWHGMG